MESPGKLGRFVHITRRARAFLSLLRWDMSGRGNLRSVDEQAEAKEATLLSMQDGELTNLLSGVHSIAAVGVTNHAASSGYDVLSYQQSQGYDVTPVNSQEQSILGMPCAKSVRDIEEPVDLVNVFAVSSNLDEVVGDAVTKNAKALWLQPGVENARAERRAHEAGMSVIKDKCFRQVHQKLMARKPF